MEAFTGRLVYFALYYLRYIVILTQIIVIGVFFYRFSIDQKVIDLKESANQKQEIIKVAQPLVQEAKLIEAKSKALKTLLAKQKKFAGDFDYMTSVIPETVTLTKLTLGDTALTLEAEAQDIVIIRKFYEKLKKDKRFKSIALNKIDKTDLLFEFSMNIGI